MKIPTTAANRPRSVRTIDWNTWLIRGALLILAGCVTLLVYSLGRGVLYNSLRQELMAMARTGAVFIDPELVEKNRQLPGDSEAYLQLRSQLDRLILATPEIADAYLVTPTDDSTKFRFLVDTDREEPAAPGEEYDASGQPELIRGLREPAADYRPTSDRWGVWLSGYAPIRGSQGETIAVLGVDLPNAEIEFWLAILAAVAGLFGLFSLMSAMAVSQWILRRSSRQVKQLAEQVQQLSDRVGGAEPVDPEVVSGDPEAVVAHYQSLVQRVEQAREESERFVEQTLKTLAAAVRTRNAYAGDDHSKIPQLAEMIAERLGLVAEERKVVRYAATLHDIGKIGIPDRILLKPGALSPDERKTIEEHPQIGYKMLSQIEVLRPVAEVVLAHHERWDGKGYPRGLTGEQIPLAARITMAVDSFVALTSDKPYRKGLPTVEAIQEIRKGAGTQFDPDVVEALSAAVSDGSYAWTK